jgi:hypothetical protein
MDKEIRNRIRKMVQDARDILQNEISELLEGVFGLHSNGTIEDISRLPAIKDDENAIKAREGFAYFIEREVSAGGTKSDAVDKLILGLTFTHLNRLVALKLMERRNVIRESVSRQTKSNGFIHYVVDVLKKTDLSQIKDIDEAYKGFILYQCQQAAEEIKVLFDPEDLSSYVFPRPRALKAVLDIINADDLDEIWEEDETIGWFYQYFTPKELREQARSESSAPRNSWELAFRNQFYTPRYVVQFLADNTLGRTWYEMRQGDTGLKDFCEYMVIPKDEVFLKEGEKASDNKDIYQIPFRQKKDPRELKILDPACGSGHFLLYVFDLLVRIYNEAYTDPDLGPKLMEAYPAKDAFDKEIPRLILENNLYGIDIDLRAIQIAALALWLRAQKEWNDKSIRRDERPLITKAHFVCAEPMPGNQELFDEFVESLQPALLRDLVRDVWEDMKLAGEAGSLLQIERELKDSIQKAKIAWQKLPKEKQLTLFGEPEQQQQFGIDLTGIKDEAFFSEAEDRVLKALKTYAEQAVAGNHEYSRRMFAEESIRGFQFIEILHKRYDVVLMNPPFGKASLLSKKYVDQMYPRTKNDVFAAFVERMLQLLQKNGFIGIISSRTGFFLGTFTKWREEILMKEASLHTISDFGFGVLEALVETAAYTLEKIPPSGRRATFFRLLNEESKGEKLKEAIIKDDHIKRFNVELEAFSLVPNTPFSYWVSDRIRNKFKEFKPFEGNGGDVRVGVQTGDDFRFIRISWEVAPRNICFLNVREWSSIKEAHSSKIRTLFLQHTNFEGWVPLAKGGEFSPYYSDIHLVVNWYNKGREIDQFRGSYIRNSDYYFQAGLTWTYRTDKGFSVRVKDAGTIHSHVGHSAFPYADMHLDELCWLNSLPAKFLLRMMTTYKWEVGYVQKIPIPISKPKTINKHLPLDLFSKYRERFISDETTHVFSLPSLITIHTVSISRAGEILDTHSNGVIEYTEGIQDKINNIVYRLYDIDSGDREYIEKESRGNSKSELGEDYENSRESEEAIISDNLYGWIHNVLMWSVGVAFGRWDIRMAMDRSLIPKLADPFDPLPVCSPGMLLSPNGYPATSGNIVSEEWLRKRVNVLDVPENVPNPTIIDADYPIDIDWDGILVDDEGHNDDIVKKVREVLSVLYGDAADDREKEILEILNIKSLRDYFRSSNKFFDFHIKRYSKSRRKAPIYWLLQTMKKNYGIWLYYHRLDSDTIFKILRNYVEPKLNLTSIQISETAQKAADAEGRDKRTYEKQLENLEDLRQEITEFKEELEKVAEMGYDPDFDDGVVLNMAPLHAVIPWKEPAKYWRELQSGKYDWAHIAMKYWPDRVKAKCKKDKSLAIAHGMA